MKSFYFFFFSNSMSESYVFHTRNGNEKKFILLELKKNDSIKKFNDEIPYIRCGLSYCNNLLTHGSTNSGKCPFFYWTEETFSYRYYFCNWYHCYLFLINDHRTSSLKYQSLHYLLEHPELPRNRLPVDLLEELHDLENLYNTVRKSLSEETKNSI